MAEKKMGVLVHGAGWVSTQHIKAFQANPHTKVVAISSRKLTSCQKRADESGLKDVGLYTDLDKALKHEGVDIVAVCTPQHLHCENVLAACEAKKHIVIEKPICNSLKEMKAMRAAVRKAKVKTVISFVLRWNPLFATLKRMIADDALGAVYYVETDYEHDIGSWWSGYEWARRKDLGVSAFLTGGCHAIDALRWFAGPGEFEAAKVVEVFAYAGGYRKGKTGEFDYITNTFKAGVPPLEYDGLEVALIKFANGAVGKVSVNFDCIQPYTFPVKVFGDKGTIRDNRVWSHKYPGQKSWVTIPSIQPDSGDVTHHPFQGEIDHFVECILKNQESHCNLDDAINTHEVVFAALECYKTKKAVKLPLI
ncbi:MAG: Gfo/Idh/MocA family oxidoreductase, partial [Planctomycetes bacterium]|nr:Gfo/Idh/MocA family oxidoreductase [Planctomycetota bacterium]